MYCPITIIDIDLLLVGYFLPAIKKLGHKHLIHDAVETLFCRFISFYTAKSVLLDSKKRTTSCHHGFVLFPWPYCVLSLLISPLHAALTSLSDSVHSLWVTLGLQHKSTSSSLIRSLCLMTAASSVEMSSMRKGERRKWMTSTEQTCLEWIVSLHTSSVNA